LAALVWLPRDRSVALTALLAPLAIAAVITVGVSALYGRPYMREHARIGDRPTREVDEFSAMPASYLAVTPNNWLYGDSRRRAPRSAAPERRLFPGSLALLLAAAGLLAARPSRRAIVYLLLLVAAFEASLGLGGYSFSFLYRHVTVFHGLRAMARLGVFVLMFVAVLAAYGYRLLVSAQPRAVRRAVLAVAMIVLLAEYRVAFALAPYPNTAPELYRVLSTQPRGVVLELPVPHVDTLPGDEARYAYASTFHWFPLVNGYSGVYPASYLGRLERLRDFPGETSLRQIQADGVRYVIVHQADFSEADRSRVREGLAAIGMAELGTFSDGAGPATLYRAH
jgi:hypothetical protein